MAVEIQIVDSPEGLAACVAIRREVFIVEQQVPEADEWDGLDAQCTHFIALRGSAHDWEETLGCARLWIGTDGVAKAQRVAVRAVSRGAGVGRALMEAMHLHAQACGCHSIVLGAQVHAVPFYAALGYEVIGDEFMDANIPHRMMVKKLQRIPGKT